MTKIAILDDYIGVALDYGDWSVLPDDAEITVYREAISPGEVVGELSGYEVVVITQQRTRFPRAVLEGLPELRLLVCNGPTSNVVDHEARIELGILLCGTADTDRAVPAGSASSPERQITPGLPAPSEMAWALIFAVAKRTGVEDRVIRAGGWQAGFPVPLAAKTLGLLGAGRLGGAMVPVAKALGMDVIAWSPNLTEQRCTELGVTRVTKEQLLSSSDVLGVFLVFSERSRNTLRADDLARMKAGAVLVNISRGPIVEEAALIEALRSGHLAGAGLDVFNREPLPADHPFRSLDNVVVTPHIGYVTERLFRSSWQRMAQDVAAYLAGSPNSGCRRSRRLPADGAAVGWDDASPPMRALPGPGGQQCYPDRGLNRRQKNHDSVARNSTQLPSGSSAMAMVTPGRISVIGTTIFRSARSQASTAPGKSATEMVQYR